MAEHGNWPAFMAMNRARAEPGKGGAQSASPARAAFLRSIGQCFRVPAIKHVYRARKRFVFRVHAECVDTLSQPRGENYCFAGCMCVAANYRAFAPQQCQYKTRRASPKTELEKLQSNHNNHRTARAHTRCMHVHTPIQWCAVAMAMLPRVCAVSI